MRDVVMFLGLAFVPVTGLLLVAYAHARARAVKAEQLVHDLTVVPALRSRPRQHDVADVRAAVEALSLEVARIAEDQRFTTRLLSEARTPVIGRSERDAAGRSITPH